MGAAILVPPGRLTVVLLIGAAASFGLFSSNHWALAQTLAGPQAAAKWTGLENCFGNLAGVLAAWLPAVVLQATHEFFYAFLIACGILLVAIFGYWFVVGKTPHVIWANERVPIRVVD
jgi:MFS-type transporter involved in bile tolerance (Atg22 family)